MQMQFYATLVNQNLYTRFETMARTYYYVHEASLVDSC